MSHNRIEIRARVADVLAKRLTFTKMVYPNRTTNIMTDELPAVVVHTPSEDVEVFAAAPRLLLRKLTVVVEVAASGDLLDDTLDGHAEEIERALATEERLGGLTRDLVLQGTESDIDSSGDRPLGSIRLTYVATYISDETFAQATEAFRYAHVSII